MGSSEWDVTSSLLAYAKLRGISIDIESEPLGIGEDGKVWRTSRSTAAKAFYREKNYLRELDCYERLREFAATDVAGFAVPELIESSDELLVIEMGIVTPPRLLDFGKAYIDRPGPFTSDYLEEYLELCSQEYSEDDWDRVMEAYYELRSYQIYYYDLRPANIQVSAD
tara:strand:+ start:396 stop:899 length:504 start_codon:yes stop_codon:yes gene_type:complete